MCGRFTLSKPVRVLAELFELTAPPAVLAPRYNVAPFQTVAVVGCRSDGTRRLVQLRWGFLPAFANSPAQKPQPINARSESIDFGMFRNAFRSSRCLIPSDGFYEWRAEGKKKLPIHFRFRDERPFGFAGLFSVWNDGTTKLATCCLLTCPPNDVVRGYHDRMPVILPPDQYAAWLDPDTPVGELKRMLVPYPANDMVAVPVVPLVNKAAAEGPECLTPAA